MVNFLTLNLQHSLQVETGKPSFQTCRLKLSLQYYMKIKATLMTFWGGWVSPPHVPPPLGNFIECQAHPNVFAFLLFSLNRSFSIFCVVKFLFSVFFVFAFRWFRFFHRGCYVHFPIVFSSTSLFILYIFIFIYFLYMFSLCCGFFDLCWVISLGCRPRIDRPAHTLYIHRIV